MGWGGGFVPEAEERARPPVISWLVAAADEQTLTWLNCTMGEPLRAGAWAQNAARRFCAQRGCSVALGCVGKGPPLVCSSPALAETDHAERNT